MANLLCEGFDWMASGLSDSVRTRLWAANRMFESGNDMVADVVTGRFDYGKALVVNFNNVFSNGSGYVIPIHETPATGFVGCAMFIYPDMGATAVAVVSFYDAVENVPQFRIHFAANGVIKIYDGAGTTLLANSEADSYQENEWFHFEAKATIGTGGTVEVRINTVPVIQLVGGDLQYSPNAYFDSIYIGGERWNSSGGHYHVAFDDLFVNDTVGATNSDWSGNLRVKTQFMIANGATDNFTIGGTAPAATNWQSVLNQNLDDTKFVYSSTIGHIDLYTPDPNLNSPLVRSLQVKMALRQDDATQRIARAVIRIGSTNYVGSVDQYTNQTFTFYTERFELNPATGVSFTGAEVNGLQAGLKLTA